MKARTLFTLFITTMSGAAYSAGNDIALSLDDAQQASGRSFAEVRAADANGDQIINAAEYAALTEVPEAGAATRDSGLPADVPVAE